MHLQIHNSSRFDFWGFIQTTSSLRPSLHYLFVGTRELLSSSKIMCVHARQEGFCQFTPMWPGRLELWSISSIVSVLRHLHYNIMTLVVSQNKSDLQCILNFIVFLKRSSRSYKKSISYYAKRCYIIIDPIKLRDTENNVNVLLKFTKKVINKVFKISVTGSNLYNMLQIILHKKYIFCRILDELSPTWTCD